MKPRLAVAIALLTVTVVSTGCAGERRGGTGVLDAGAASSAPVTTNPVPETTTSPVTSAAPAHSAASKVTAPPTTRPAALSAASRLRIDGVGPIDVGMTVAEARAAAGTELSLRHEPFCDVLTAPRGPEGLALMLTTPATGRIELIIVTGGSVATLSGIRIGSTEAEVVAAYPGRLRSVNPSRPVHRLIYQAKDPALADRVLVFVIDNSRVASMYAGLDNQAEADEICG